MFDASLVYRQLLREYQHQQPISVHGVEMGAASVWEEPKRCCLLAAYSCCPLVNQNVRVKQQQ